MKFMTKKQYGNSKEIDCPFCNRIATQKNEQGVEVCHQHTKSSIEEIRCTCGSWLEQRTGKFGLYFNCINCGNINYTKAMEIKSITTKNKLINLNGQEKSDKLREIKEKTITSNDVEYFD